MATISMSVSAWPPRFEPAVAIHSSVEWVWVPVQRAEHEPQGEAEGMTPLRQLSQRSGRGLLPAFVGSRRRGGEGFLATVPK